MQLFLGIFLAVVGPLMTVQAEWFYQNFGAIPWAEEHLGTSGGTRLFYKLLGLVFFFFGLMMVFGLFDNLVLWVFSPLLPRQRF